MNYLKPKKQKGQLLQEQQQAQQQLIEQPRVKQQDLHFFNKLIKKDTLFVTFNGIIEAGAISNCQSLILSYVITSGSDWKIVSGQKTGISQIGANDGEKIVWNLPFQISFQTTYLSGWPQLIVILQGFDFFGRPFVEGYGNIHLPSSSGIQNRKIRVFKPLPQSIISGIFGYLGGLIATYKDYEKVLSSGEGREVTRVCTQGQINVKVEATKHNFKMFGYE